MYNVHPSEKLIHAFRQKPYQGCCPTQAEFLFIGLDANYAPNIEEQKYFLKSLNIMRMLFHFGRNTMYIILFY